MKENEQPMTNRERFSARMKSKYPEREFADDEDMFGQIEIDYTDYEDQLGKYKEREGKLNELFSRDPRSAQFITDMAKGKDPWIAVIERVGVDGISDIMNDPSKQEEYAAANKAYMERLAKEKSYEEEYNKNLADSMALLSEIQQKKGLSDDMVDAAMNLIIGIANEAIMGKFSKDTIKMALKALKYDADMENAKEEGMISGRNQRIEEKLRKQGGGDGMPVMDGANNAPEPMRNARKSIFDIAQGR